MTCSAPRLCLSSGARNFSCTSSHEDSCANVHVHFACADSHKVVVALEGRGFFPANFRIKWLVWDFHVHFDCAGLRKVVVALVGARHFPVNSRIKWFLWDVLYMHFDCAGLRQVAVALLGRGIFPVNSRKRILAQSPCAAFRPRWLAQSGCRAPGARHFSCTFLHKWFLWDFYLHFDCAGSREVCAAGFSSSWSATFSCEILAWTGSCGDPAKFLPKRPLHDPVHVLSRKSCGDPGGILSKRSLHEDLADAMSYRCLYDSSCGRLLGGSCIQILQDPLQQQQQVLFLTTLWDSLGGPTMQIFVKDGQGLLQVLVGRSCVDPREMLSGAFAWSCTGPCGKLLACSGEILWGPRCPYIGHDLVQVLVRRSCGDPVEILLAMSLH